MVAILSRRDELIRCLVSSHTSKIKNYRGNRRILIMGRMDISELSNLCLRD